MACARVITDGRAMAAYDHSIAMVARGMATDDHG